MSDVFLGTNLKVADIFVEIERMQKDLILIRMLQIATLRD